MGVQLRPRRPRPKWGGGNSLNVSVLRAKTFFDTNWSAEAKTRYIPDEPLQALVASMDVVPDWEYAVLSENEVESYLEVPLISDTRLGFGPVGVTDESQILISDRRLVVRQIKETGEMYLYTSLWIPDDEVSLLAMPSLTMFDKGLFSGRIYFFHPDGTFYWGAGFSEGLPVSSVTLVDEDDEYEVHTGPTTREADVTYHCDLVTEWILMKACQKGPNGEPINCYETGNGWIKDQYVECWGNGGGNIPIPTDPDGLGPGYGFPPPIITNKTPKAKKLFKSNNLTDTQWEALEEMLNKITGNCMGEALYDALASKGQFTIEFGDSSVKAGSFSNGNFTVNDYNSGTLFHEMFHAWQWYQESATTVVASSANRELEAYLAEYRFTGNLTSSQYARNIILMSNAYISPQGAFTPPNDELMPPFDELYMNSISLINQQYRMFNNGNDLGFDPNRSFNQNFKNLQYLSNKC